MNIETLKKKIESLKTEIQAMKDDPLLQENYAHKIMELIKLRRSLIRRGKSPGKNKKNSEV